MGPIHVWGLALAVETKRQLRYIPPDGHSVRGQSWGCDPGAGGCVNSFRSRRFDPRLPCQGSDLVLRDVTPGVLAMYTTGDRDREPIAGRSFTFAGHGNGPNLCRRQLG